MRATSILLLSIALGAAPAFAREVVAVKAGTIHRVEGGEVVRDGTILIDDGRIVAVGTNVAVPPSARVVDYGADAVVTPGLVSADSTLGGRRGSERTADPSLLAIDAFDFQAVHALSLAEGVTTVYLPPARGRLIAGQGAVVKLAGKDETSRTLSPVAAVHGSIGADARNTPGYWKPPLPATADVGMGVEQPQLPKTLMGAMVALDELVALAKGGDGEDEYGPDTGPALRELIAARVPWRIGASTEPEIRALVAFAREKGLPVVVDGAGASGEVAREIAAAGLAVVFDPPIAPNSAGRDFGKQRDAQWPDYGAAARLAEAGVRFAIAPPDDVGASELRFAAAVASRGGLDRARALRAITLDAAEILGVASRVGSLTPGKDADLAVFSGDPLGGSSVVATWVSGEIVHQGDAVASVVISVEELHLGDGQVLAPGEVLLEGGRVRAVGRRVGRPQGAAVVRGKAAMPGMIDAFGHLGLEGSTKVPPTRFELARLVEPGDLADRRVARAGVTTVVLAPRGASKSGAPMMAYKPAGEQHDRMVVADPAALRFQWTDKNRLDSGKAMREVLAKAVEYKKKWDEYQKKRAEWTPPKEDAPAAPAKEDKKEGAEADKGEKKPEGEGAKAEGEKKEADKKDAEKKDGEEEKKDDKKKPKKKGEKEPAKPVTGAWETKVTIAPFAETRLRLYLNETDGKVEGSLRCAALSDDLVAVTGKRAEADLTLSGEGTRGPIELAAKQEDGKLVGSVTLGSTKAQFSAEQTSTEYEVAGRSERRKPKEKKAEGPARKGEPKAPATDPDLEPLRRAIAGDGAVVVGVDREDEILACVDAFEAAGIKPILLGAEDAHKVVDKLRGRVAGVLLSPRVVQTEPKTGVEKRNRYEEIAGAGIPVAFHSAAEEGAADLPLIAAYAMSNGMSPEDALRALTSGAARMYAIDDRVGKLSAGLDGDVVLLDGSPYDASTSVVRVWVDGREVR